jgi:hypothetical protein
MRFAENSRPIYEAGLREDCISEVFESLRIAYDLWGAQSCTQECAEMASCGGIQGVGVPTDAGFNSPSRSGLEMVSRLP